MTENKLLEEISQEYEQNGGGGFSGDLSYEERKQGPSNRPLVYRVANRNPRDLAASFVPGIRMISSRKQGVETIKMTEMAPLVRAVILFTSHGRSLGRGAGSQFKIVCQSHDGATPSLRIQQPLCRNVTAEDLAQTFSQWKGYDKAKVDAQIAEVTEGTGRLQMCGLKTPNGCIPICKYAKRDPDTGARAACKQHVFVHAYDIERKREFTMELTGQSIENGQRFIAPFHEFFKFLRSQQLPSYAFALDLSPGRNGEYFYANFSNWSAIEQAENRKDMRSRAEAAKEAYQTRANWVPDKKDESQSSPSQQASMSQPTSAQTLPPSFDDDDIKF